MTIRFGILGPLSVHCGEDPVNLGSPKQRAVLALLLINANRPLAPDVMIDALWGDRPPDSAVATLQAYISNLRRALEPDRPARSPARLLQKNGGGYQLTIDSDNLDSLRFERLVTEATGLLAHEPSRARALVDEALTSWRGPALADFRYDTFTQAEIIRLEEMRVGALELRGSADLALGRGDGLIAELEALTAEHPLRERLWGQLMLALYRAGRQAEALRAYRRCEELLSEELGIVPGEELRELEMAILNQDVALKPPARSRGLHPPPPPIPAAGGSRLIGRVFERRLFAGTLGEVSSGSGAIWLIEGEPGIGKTRLIECLARDAVDAGFTTAIARCVEVGGTPPFWPWIQLARQLGIERISAAAGEYASYLAPLTPYAQLADVTPGPPLFRLAEGLGVALRTLAQEQPLLLIIDDLYSADPDSLSMLSVLAADLERVPLMIVGSHRGQELPPDHPLSDTLAQLIRFDWVRRVPLSRFDLAEVAELVEELTGSPVEPTTIRAIHQRTEGNAFFTAELTKLLQAETDLDPGRVVTAVPGTILEVIGKRLAGFSDEALKLVRTGAVAGREFELSIAAETLGLELEGSLSAVEEALKSGFLLETDQPGVYRFSHMIVVNCVTQALGAVRRAHLHHDLAQAMERRDRDDPSRLVEIAHHRVQAAPVMGTRPAIAALSRAGEHAMQSTALELSEELFQQRYDMVMSMPPSPKRDRAEVAALFDLARLWTWKEGYHSENLGRATQRLWELTGVPSEAVEFDPDQPITSSNPVLSTLQARFSFEIVSGDVDGSRKVVDRLLQLASKYPDPMVRFAANLSAAVERIHSGDVAGAVAAVERTAEALERLDPTHTDPLMLPLGQQSGWVTHHSFAAWVYWEAGDRHRAKQEAARSRLLCDRFGHAFTRAFCGAVESIVAAMDRDPEWAAEAIRWVRLTEDDGIFSLMDLWVAVMGAWADGMRDVIPVESALQQMHAIVGALEQEGALIIHTLFLGLIAELELKRDRPDLAREAAQRGIERTRVAGERFWYPELERLASVAAGRLGYQNEQRNAFRRAEGAAREMGMVPIIDRLTPRMASG